MHAANDGSLHVEFTETSVNQTETRTLSAHKEQLCEEQMLLSETLQTTISIPVEGKQSCRCRDSHVVLLQPLASLSTNDGGVHCPAHLKNMVAAGPNIRRWLDRVPGY